MKYSFQISINVSPWQARNQQMPDTPESAFKFSIWKVKVTYKFLAFKFHGLVSDKYYFAIEEMIITSWIQFIS